MLIIIAAVIKDFSVMTEKVQDVKHTINKRPWFIYIINTAMIQKIKFLKYW